MPEIAAPEAPADNQQIECWFEVNLNFTEDMKRNRPTRIFSSKDERWGDFEKDKATRGKYGSLNYGSYLRSGEEFMPNTVRIRDSMFIRWDTAREKMASFEKTGKVYDTFYQDQLAEREEAEKRGQANVAAAITEGLKAAFAGKVGAPK